MVLNRSPEFVSMNQHQIENIFSGAVQSNVIIDEISPFYDTLNFVDSSKLTVDIHATHLTTDTLELLRAFDEKESLINELLFTAGISILPLPLLYTNSIYVLFCFVPLLNVYIMLAIVLHKLILVGPICSTYY